MKSEKTGILPDTPERVFPGLYYEPDSKIVVLAQDEETSFIVHSDNPSWFITEEWGSLTPDAIRLPPTAKITLSN
jgi:hypothetical protein